MAASGTGGRTDSGGDLADRRMLIVLGAGLAVGAVLGLAHRPAPAVAPPPTLAAPTAEIDVHVTGWVVSPGVVRVREGSIVAHAVEAAGGMRPGAVTEAVNLAAPLAPGQQVLVPGPGTEPAGVPAGDSAVSVNTARAADLEALPGVGPVLAERIVAHRDEHGPFSTAEDLLDVAGIGEAKLAQLRDHIRVP